MITKRIKEKIREYFFENPTRQLRVRQIEKELQAPLPSAIRYAKELENEGMLKKSGIAGVTLYSADRSSKKFLLEKKLYNIRILFESGFVDYLIEEYSNPAIILFGSFSKGEDIETSDIDLYVETSAAKKLLLTKFEEKLGRKIQLFCYNNIHQIKNKELANNIINGISLNGFLEVLK